MQHHSVTSVCVNDGLCLFLDIRCPRHGTRAFLACACLKRKGYAIYFFIQYLLYEINSFRLFSRNFARNMNEIVLFCPEFNFQLCKLTGT
jgi:hypothetical protein